MKNRAEETKRRRNVLIAISILCIINIGSIIIIEKMKPQPDMDSLWQNIVLSILCSLVASFIFLYMQRGLEHDRSNELIQKLEDIDEKLRIQGELYDSGIKSIRKKSFYDKNDDFWRRIIQNVDGRMDLIGHSLSHWMRREYKELFCGKIISMINAEKTVRLVLSCKDKEFNIENVIKVLDGKSEKKKLSKVEKTYYEFASIIQDIDPKKRKYLELYIAERTEITYLYIRTDNQCFISPYIHSPTNSRNSFLLELETGAEYSRCFEEDFDELIENMDSIKWE